jgi:SOS-response transcriptional repressor LexA
MEQKLTAKQKNILEYIRELTMQNGEKPTSYRLHKYLISQGMSDSMKSVMQVIESLEKKELITRDENKKIYLVENENYGNAQNVFSIPLYGLASCGEALAYADDSTADDFLQISKSLFHKARPEKLFAVKALGDSMNKDGICDGDYVIFEKVEEQDDFENEIVVAVINGMATIKRYKNMGKGVIGLFPHSTNDTHHPIYLSETDTIFIAGIFRKVLPVKFVSL